MTAVTESRVRIKSSDGKTIEGKKFGNKFAGNEKYSQFVRDVEGQISVDLINEYNQFHRASDVFRLTQQFIGALPTEDRTISGPKFSKSGPLTPQEAEFRATEQAYGGRDAYEQAKAEGQTKLGYGQWVQVRTPSC